MTDHLLIIIVNYRTPGLVIDCLRSLVEEQKRLRDMSVVVCDNASGDNSVEIISSYIGDRNLAAWVTLLPLEVNGGFGAGNNAAIRLDLKCACPHSYYMLLNPDTIVLVNAIRNLYDYLNDHPEVGVVGGRMIGTDGEIDDGVHSFPHPIKELSDGARLGLLDRMIRSYVDPPVESIEPMCADWVSGANMMIRRSVVEEIGLLDEDYFLYFDEVDWCYRVQQTDWKIVYVPEARIIHLEGAATGITDVRKRRTRFWYESRRRFMVKAYGVLGLMVADVLWAIGRFSLGVRRFLRLGGGPSHDPIRHARDLLIGDLKAIVSGSVWRIDRKKIQR